MVSLNRPSSDGSKIFTSRTDAGKKLGSRLSALREKNPLVLARPTRDMPVGAQIARSLDGQLDVWASKKLRSPANAKLSIGTVLESGLTSLKGEIIRILDISPSHVEEERRRRRDEIEEEMGQFRKQHPRIPLRDRTVVVAVEGLLHGGSIKPRLKALRSAEPRDLILAVPIAPQLTLRNLRPLVDDLVPLHEEAGYFPRVDDFYNRQLKPDEHSVLLFQRN